ncbi:MAG TPA: cytochrome c oxidase subunit 3 [Anaerolineales bacterium]|jgi:cytochrome c oxidase subunit 3|nr:cytochrome c oxidase subunit 3 [Anaerolineales bacterium]
MTTETQTLSKYQYKSATNRLGLWLFIISDSFLFLGLLATRFYLFGDQRPDVNPLLGVTVTSVLLLSSFFMNRAETLMSFGDRRGFLNNVLITIVLGTLFLVGVVGVEWQIAPFGIGDNAIASVFFTMTGFHALHVLSGVVFLLIVYRNARKELYSAERHFPVEAAAVYWHFVDVVWVFFYPALYLIGRAAV